jgi:hypothetical protein
MCRRAATCSRPNLGEWCARRESDVRPLPSEAKSHLARNAARGLRRIDSNEDPIFCSYEQLRRWWAVTRPDFDQIFPKTLVPKWASDVKSCRCSLPRAQPPANRSSIDSPLTVRRLDGGRFRARSRPPWVSAIGHHPARNGNTRERRRFQFRPVLNRVQRHCYRHPTDRPVSFCVIEFRTCVRVRRRRRRCRDPHVQPPSRRCRSAASQRTAVLVCWSMPGRH